MLTNTVTDMASLAFILSVKSLIAVLYLSRAECNFAILALTSANSRCVRSVSSHKFLYNSIPAILSLSTIAISSSNRLSEKTIYEIFSMVTKK